MPLQLPLPAGPTPPWRHRNRHAAGYIAGASILMLALYAFFASMLF